MSFGGCLYEDYDTQLAFIMLMSNGTMLGW